MGKISEKNIELFLGTVRGKKLTTLVIASGGGEINAGMKMGSWVFDNHIDVVVEKMCMSSCANYVFTAGRHKTINPGTIVAWHGSVLQESILSEEDIRVSAIQAFDKLSESEKAKRDLQEMTFYGFTQEKIKKQLAQLEKEAKEAKKNPSSLRKLVKNENGEEFFWEDKKGEEEKH